MLACPLINMWRHPVRERATTCLSAHSVMNALSRGACLFGCARMVSLASVAFLFGLGYFHL